MPRTPRRQYSTEEYPCRASQVNAVMRRSGYRETLERVGKIWAFVGGTSERWASNIVPVPYDIGDLSIGEWMAWRNELASTPSPKMKKTRESIDKT